jgi:hypothetical protein
MKKKALLLFFLKVGPLGKFRDQGKHEGETKTLLPHYFPHLIHLCVLQIGVGSLVFLLAFEEAKFLRDWRRERRLP